MSKNEYSPDGKWRVRMAQYDDGRYIVSISKLMPLFWEADKWLLTKDKEEAEARYEEYLKELKTK